MPHVNLRVEITLDNGTKRDRRWADDVAKDILEKWADRMLDVIEKDVRRTLKGK